MALGASMLQACASRTHYGRTCRCPGLLCSLSAWSCSPPRPGPPGRDSTGGVGGPRKRQPCLLDKGQGTGTLGGDLGAEGEGTARPPQVLTSPGAQGSLGARTEHGIYTME